jgi:simple sugar transport system permease protein
VNSFLDILAATLRLATPLILAAMGGLVSERSGVINIALEGKMLVGAFVAAVVAYYTGSPWLGLAAGALAGAALGALYGFLAITLRANQIVAGTGINLLAAGVAPFAGKVLFDVTSSTPALPLTARLAEAPPYLAFAVAILLTAWLRLSRGGLRLAFAGEHPGALATAGVDVRRLRHMAVACAGALAGLGGATLSIYLSSSYTRNMTAGRGFIALAALILGKWRPVPALVACLVFAAADAAQIRLQGVEWPGVGAVPVQFIQIIPYVVTLVVLAGLVGEARAPRALGTNELGA